MPSAIAGAMLLPPGDPRIAQYQESLALSNPEHRQWAKRMTEAHERGRKFYEAEPEPMITPVGEMDDGPWKGGGVVPRCAPGVDGKDSMVMPLAEKLTFNGESRDYQSEAGGSFLDYGGTAIIQAPCGAGKSVIGCQLTTMLDTPALVLVHTRDLAVQWQREIERFTGVKAPVVGYGKAGDGSGARIAVASMQTLATWGWWRVHQWGRQWGFVIQDEAHHAPSRTMTEVLSGLSGRWRLGLTATPKRADGLTPWLRMLLGPTVAQISPTMLENLGRTLAPEIRVMEMPPSLVVGFDELASHERDRALADDAVRNQMVVNEIRKCVLEGRRTLVLVKLVEHAQRLADWMKESGLDAVSLTGDMPKKLRGQSIDRMRAGTVEVVTATSLADEGLDAPRLDTLFMLQPCGDMGKIEQRIGRVARPHPEALSPRVYDIVDAWGPYRGYAKRRYNLYRSRGWL